LINATELDQELKNGVTFMILAAREVVKHWVTLFLQKSPL